MANISRKRIIYRPEAAVRGWIARKRGFELDISPDRPKRDGKRGRSPGEKIHSPATRVAVVSAHGCAETTAISYWAIKKSITH